MANTKQFVSSIRLTAKDKNAIPAGMPFGKSIMVKSTFDALVKQGYITKVTPGEAPAAPITEKEGKALAVGLPNETPDAAITPIVQPGIAASGVHTPESANPTETTSKTAVPSPAEPKTPGEGVDAAKNDEAEKSAKIWTYTPESVAELPMLQLLDTLKARCAEFSLDLAKFKFTDAAKLREFLSSEFGK